MCLCVAIAIWKNAMNHVNESVEAWLEYIKLKSFNYVKTRPHEMR